MEKYHGVPTAIKCIALYHGRNNWTRGHIIVKPSGQDVALEQHSEHEPTTHADLTIAAAKQLVSCLLQVIAEVEERRAVSRSQ